MARAFVVVSLMHYRIFDSGHHRCSMVCILYFINNLKVLKIGEAADAVSKMVFSHTLFMAFL